MRAHVLTLLVLVACGGRQSDAPDPVEAEDVEIPWSAEQSEKRRMEAIPKKARDGDTPSQKAQRHKGALVDFEVKNTDLHDAIRLLAETADINIVVADSVSGRLTLRLQQVSWRQILQTIANMKELELSEQDGIYYLQ